MITTYFGYGSNLNPEDLRRWCERQGLENPLQRRLGAAYLPDHELIFNYHSTSRRCGTLNLKRRPGQVVPGVLFEVQEADWKILDRKEGAPICYERRTVQVLTDDGQCREAITYTVTPRREEPGFIAPSAEYVEIVRAGLESNGLTTRMLDAVAQANAAPSLVDGLFVYGTLRQGECRHHLLAPSLQGCVPATAPGRLVDLGEYPGLVPRHVASDRGEVEGELLAFVNLGAVVRLCDPIEGFQGYGVEGSLFRRGLLGVKTCKGSSLLAWAYILEEIPSSPSFIDSGNWLERGQASSLSRKSD